MFQNRRVSLPENIPESVKLLIERSQDRLQPGQLHLELFRFLLHFDSHRLHSRKSHIELERLHSEFCRHYIDPNENYLELVRSRMGSARTGIGSRRSQIVVRRLHLLFAGPQRGRLAAICTFVRAFSSFRDAISVWLEPGREPALLMITKPPACGPQTARIQTRRSVTQPSRKHSFHRTA